ncbi:hypothetical protein ABLN73_05465, partial [Mycobacterium tuberculosis]
ACFAFGLSFGCFPVEVRQRHVFAFIVETLSRFSCAASLDAISRLPQIPAELADAMATARM